MAIGLMAYAFRIKERNSNSSFVNLDDVNGIDMMNFMQAFLYQWSNGNYYTNPDSIKAFTVLSVNTDTSNRRISGQFISGEGGIPAEIRNINNINQVNYNKQAEDSECIPLYYLFYLPPRTLGILILERFRRISVKQVLSNLIRQHFNSNFHDFTIEIEPLPQRRLLEMYLREGSVKKITLSSYNSPGNSIEERYANDNRDIEELATYEFTIRSRRNKDLNLFQRFLSNIANGNANLDSFSNLVGIREFIPTEITATFDINGKQKNIRLDQPDEINAIYDISSELDDVNAHPNYNVINNLAIEYLNSLLNNG